MNKPYYIVFCFLFIGSASAMLNAQDLQSGSYLSIGSISNTPKQEIAKFQPFIDHLVASLDHPLIKTGRVIVANSLDEMSTLIKQDEVDLYIDSPFPILAIQASTGGVPFMRRWKKGISEYSSVIFVRKDSGIHSLDDLQGKIVAFEEEFSTSGYFLPKASLINSGFELIERLRKHDPVPRNKVGFVFSRDDETTMIWVLRNKVAAGALNKSAFFLLSKSKLNDLRVIKETIKVPRQVVVHRANLPETLRRQISTALLDMHNNAEGRKVLENFSTTKKFELLNVNELTEINKLFHLVDTNVEF